jgi:hypothetical protein
MSEHIEDPCGPNPRILKLKTMDGRTIEVKVDADVSFI